MKVLNLTGFVQLEHGQVEFLDELGLLQYLVSHLGHSCEHCLIAVDQWLAEIVEELSVERVVQLFKQLGPVWFLVGIDRFISEHLGLGAIVNHMLNQGVTIVC